MCFHFGFLFSWFEPPRAPWPPPRLMLRYIAIEELVFEPLSYTPRRLDIICHDLHFSLSIHAAYLAETLSPSFIDTRWFTATIDNGPASFSRYRLETCRLSVSIGVSHASARAADISPRCLSLQGYLMACLMPFQRCCCHDIVEIKSFYQYMPRLYCTSIYLFLTNSSHRLFH